MFHHDLNMAFYNVISDLHANVCISIGEVLFTAMLPDNLVGLPLFLAPQLGINGTTVGG
jgi:hypothetical protein